MNAKEEYVKKEIKRYLDQLKSDQELSLLVAVEGNSDIKFYKRILKIDDSSALFVADWTPRYRETKNNEKPKRLETDQKNYNFPKIILEMSKKIEGIRSFGIIDRDFYHCHNGKYIKEDDKTNNLAVTEMHDRESSLLRHFLGIFLLQCKDSQKPNEGEKNNLVKSMLILINQGILEETSFEMKINCHNDYINFYKISKKYFDDKQGEKYFDLIKKDEKNEENVKIENIVDGHISSGANELDQDTKEHFNEFKDNVRNKRGEIYLNKDENQTKELFRKIIEGESLAADESQKVDLFFKYTNGHYFINQLIAILSPYETKKEDDVFKNVFDKLKDESVNEAFKSIIDKYNNFIKKGSEDP